MSRTQQQNGWNEWSNVVLKELDRLNENYNEIDQKMDLIKTELTKIKTVWNSIEEFKNWKKVMDEKAIIKVVDDLTTWKDKIDEVWNPTQMDIIKDKVEKQESKWTMLITIWTVIQFILSILFVFKDKIF